MTQNLNNFWSSGVVFLSRSQNVSCPLLEAIRRVRWYTSWGALPYLLWAVHCIFMKPPLSGVNALGAQTMRCIPCPSQRLWPANDLYSEEAERCWLSLSLGRVSECQRLATEPNLTGTLTWQLQQQICCMCFHFTRSVAKAHGRVLISEQVCGRAWTESAQPRPNFQPYPCDEKEWTTGPVLTPLLSASHLGPLADPAANCLQHVWLSCQ